MTGCAGARLHPVTGKVVFPDGTPFAGGTVCFNPVDPVASPASAEGEVRADGTFCLRSNGVGDGAYPGKYRACILLPEPANYNPNRPQRLPIDRRFTDTRTSGLEFTVEKGPNDFTLTVTAPSPGKK